MVAKVWRYAAIIVSVVLVVVGTAGVLGRSGMEADFNRRAGELTARLRGAETNAAAAVAELARSRANAAELTRELGEERIARRAAVAAVTKLRGQLEAVGSATATAQDGVERIAQRIREVQKRDSITVSVR